MACPAMECPRTARAAGASAAGAVNAAGASAAGAANAAGASAAAASAAAASAAGASATGGAAGGDVLYRRVDLASRIVQVPFAKAKYAVPDGHAIVRAAYHGCKKPLHLRLVGTQHAAPRVDESGVVQDAWWCVASDGLPDRYVRLMHGSESMTRMMRHYALLDQDSCMHTMDGDVWCAPAATVEGRLRDVGMSDVPVRAELHERTGVPQRVVNSGICWFASVCFALFYHARVRAHVLARLPPDLRPDAERCLSDPAAAERLRVRLWERYAFGDRIGQAPELDGQNAAAQIFILFAQLGLPVRRFLMMDDQRVEIRTPVRDMRGGMHHLPWEAAADDDVHLVVIRFRRGQHSQRSSHRITPFVDVDGKEYRLAAILIGSEHCGHQIAAASPGGSVREWACCDADGRRLGIGPTLWRTDKVASRSARDRNEALRKWEAYWRHMLPAINFSKGVCNMSPLNPKLGTLARHGQPVRVTGLDVPGGGTDEGTADAGLTNLDLLYISSSKR